MSTAAVTRALCAGVGMLLLVVTLDASAARWMLTRSGALLHAPATAKSQAFCQANPQALLAFTDAISLTPASGQVLESVGSVAVQANVSVDAVCIPGPVTLRLRYGVLSGSTASVGSDYQPFELRLASPPLATFAPATMVRATATLVLVDDEVVEEVETIRLGLLGGEALGDPNNPLFGVIGIPGSSNALAIITIEDDAPDLTETVTTALGNAQNVVAAAAVAPLAENCSTASDQTILDQCAAIVELAETSDPSALVEVLNAISGEEVSAQITSSIDGGNQRGSQIDSRVAALRGGATGISLDDIAFNYGGQQVPLSMMFNALAAADEPAADEGFGGGLLDQRLGAFFNATRIGGERDASNFEVGFDFDGYSVLGGVDWRFTDRFIAGAAIGWSSLDSDLGDDGGGLETDGWSLTGYGTWLINDRAFLDFAIAHLSNDYDQARVVDLSLLGQGFGRSTALGSTDAAQTSIGFGGGFDVPLGEWVWSPRGAVLLSSTAIDGFTESGADINDLIFADQDFDSLVYTFSQSLSRSFSIGAGALQPYLLLDLSREARNKAFGISPVLRVRPEQRSTPVFIEESDRSFGRGELGVSLIGSRGYQWFFSYSQLLGYDKVDAWALRGGIRLEF